MKKEKYMKIFPQIIIARGKDYYLNGNVTNLKKENGIYTAIVKGTTKYNVLIKIDDNDITYMECDCPYCYDSGYCKHIVATIMEINERENIKKFSYDEEKYENDEYDEYDEYDEDDEYDGHDDDTISYNIYEELYNMTKEELINIILNEFNRSSEFRYQYYLSKKRIRAEDLIDQYQNIKNHYEDFDGMIDYYSANEFGDEMVSFINDLESVIENKENGYEVLQLIFYVFDDLDNIEIDDSSGNLSTIMLLQKETILSIVHRYHEYEMDVVEFALDYIKNKRHGIAIDTLIQIINDIEYDDKESVLYLKNEIEKIISEEYNKNTEDYYHYVLRQLLVLLPTLYAILRLSNDEIDSFLKQYIYIPEIADYYINVELRNNNYNQAIKITKQIIKENERYTGIRHKYMNKLVVLYEETSDKNNLIDNLKTIILEFNDLEMYKKLKSIISKEEFKQFFEELEIIKERNFSFINMIYLEENLKEKLINSILRENDLYGNEAIKYEPFLIEEYNEILLNFHKTNIVQRLERACKRQEYRRLAYEIEQLKRFNNYHLSIKEILRTIQEKYKKKTALQDEMSLLYIKYIDD